MTRAIALCLALLAGTAPAWGRRVASSPSTPMGLTAAAVSSSQINLSWSGSTDPNYASQQLTYRIYRDGALAASTAAGTTTWTDSGLAAGTTYSYAVQAVDPSGNVSSLSGTAQATTPSGTSASSASYTTNFPLTEDPISEGGKWISGSVALHWADVRTTPGFAFGTQSGSNGTDDSTAVLAGAWGSDQKACGTARIGTIPAGAYEEIELRLHTTISASGSITGYEINFSASSAGNAYIQFVRWDGWTGSGTNYTYIGDAPYQTGVNGPGIHTGDQLCAWNSGNKMHISINGVEPLYNGQPFTATDSTYTGGSPGIGLYLQCAGSSSCSSANDADYGWTSFTGTNLSSSGDTTPPSTPTNLSGTAVSSSQIKLAWSASTDNVAVAGYNVFRNNVQVATVSSTSYTDSGLSPSSQYSYSVDAFDAAGNVSPQSAPVTASTMAADTTPPSVPVMTQASNVSSSSLTVSWTASTDNVAVAGYRVFRNGTQIGTTTATSYNDSGLSPSTTYSYTVAAFDTSNNVSAQSQPLSVTTQASAAAPPTFVQVNQNQIGSGSSVSVALNTPTTAGNTIVAYVIWSNTGVASVSDSSNNSFVPVSPPVLWSNGQYSAQVFYATGITGAADTITASFRTSVNTFGVLYVQEYSGIDAANPVDVTVSAAGSGTTLSSGTAVTTSANDLIFGAGVSDYIVSAAGSGFQARDLAYGNITEDLVGASAGSYSATATNNGNYWGMQLVAFRAK